MSNTIIRKEQGGVAPGGNTGEVYTKNSNADYDAGWAPASSGGNIYIADSVEYSDNSGGTVTLNSYVLAGNTVTDSNTIRMTLITTIINNVGASVTLNVKLNGSTAYAYAPELNNSYTRTKLTVEIYKNGGDYTLHIVEESFDEGNPAITRTEYALYDSGIATSAALTIDIQSQQAGTPGGAEAKEFLLKLSNI